MIYAVEIPLSPLASPGVSRSHLWIGTASAFHAELPYLAGVLHQPGPRTIHQGGLRTDGTRCIVHRVIGQAEGDSALSRAFRERFAAFRAEAWGQAPGLFLDVPPIRSALALPPWEGWTGDDAAALNVVRPRVDQDRPAPLVEGLAGRVRNRS